MPLGSNGYIYTFRSRAVPADQCWRRHASPCCARRSTSPRTFVGRTLPRHVDPSIYPCSLPHLQTDRADAGCPLRLVYTSSYERWGRTHSKETYAWMNALLAPVRGEQITARQKLREGVFVTTYANGKQIVVNYTQPAFCISGPHHPRAGCRPGGDVP